MRDQYVKLNDEALIATVDRLLAAACDERLTYNQRAKRLVYYHRALAVAVSRGLVETDDELYARLRNVE